MSEQTYRVPTNPMWKRADLGDPAEALTDQAPIPTESAEPVEPPPPSASEGVHPLAISPEEGLPAIPQDQLVAKLEKLVALKNGAMLMYSTYADALRAPFRDSLYAHFEDHAKEERAGVYDFNMKIIALGGTLTPKVAKPAPASGIQEILTAVIQFEKKLIHATRELLAACGEYDGLRLLLEENLLNDQRHLDDARRMLVTLP